MFISNVTLNTYVVPTGALSLIIWAVGGGGGGGGVESTGLYSAGGGGAGGLSRVTFAVSPGDVVQVSVGAGGMGGNDTVSAGLDGEDTTVSFGGNPQTIAQGGQGAGFFGLNGGAGNGGSYLYGDIGMSGGVGGSGSGSIFSAPYGGGGGGTISNAGYTITATNSFHLGEGTSGIAAYDNGVQLFKALGVLGLVPPDPANGACYFAPGCGGACAAVGRTCRPHRGDATCPYRCDRACLVNGCDSRCPPGTTCNYDGNLASSCQSSNQFYSANFYSCTSNAVTIPSRQLGVTCFNDFNCGFSCGKGRVCQYDAAGALCSYSTYACVPAPPMVALPAGGPACFSTDTCGGYCGPDEVCALNGTSSCVAGSNFTFSCAPRSPTVVIQKGNLCFSADDCQGTCEQFGALCSVAYSISCGSQRPFSCIQDCASPWNSTCGGGYCSLLESASCVRSTRTCSASGSFDCIGPDTSYGNDNTCAGGCAPDEICSQNYIAMPYDGFYTCNKLVDGCFSTNCAGLCPAGTSCQNLRPGLGGCAASSYYGWSCETVDTSSCLSDSSCLSACPAGTTCKVVTPSLAGAWGVCESVPVAWSVNNNGLYYQPGVSGGVFAMGFTCRPCTAGDVCFNPNSCFSPSSCSSCPRDTVCANVGISAPCTADLVGAGSSYTCLNVTLQPGCHLNDGGCSNSCGSGEQCMYSSLEDCMRFPTRVGASAMDVSTFSYANYKCSRANDCYTNSVCNDACNNFAGTLCTWVGGAGPCSAASPGYTCAAVGSTPTAMCFNSPACGSGCLPGSQCLVDTGDACTHGVYGASPPPPMPSAPPALVPNGTLYHGWTSEVERWGDNCNLSTYDSIQPTASGGFYPYNAGDSFRCRAWKLAATICTSQPILLNGGPNWACSPSGGFTDPTFGSFCATSQQIVCSQCMGGSPGDPCFELCSYQCSGSYCKIPISMRSCSGAVSIVEPVPPAPPPAVNYRCHGTTASYGTTAACYADQYCLGSCGNNSYCSGTPRCGTSFNTGSYSCFPFNNSAGQCWLWWPDCYINCNQPGFSCQSDQSCLTGTGTSPMYNGGYNNYNGQIPNPPGNAPYRCVRSQNQNNVTNNSSIPPAGGSPSNAACASLSNCSATCKAPATCVRNADVTNCESYSCHVSTECFAAAPQCLGLCAASQTCSFIGSAAPCGAATPGYACSNISAACFTQSGVGSCPAGTMLAYDFSRRTCTSNSSAYAAFPLSPADVRGTFACLGTSACFAPRDAASCAAVCEGTPCVPDASLTDACGKGSAAVVLPGSRDGFALVCPNQRLPKRTTSGRYILPLVTSLPLAGVMVAVGVAHAMSAEQRQQLARLLPRFSMDGLSNKLMRKPAPHKSDADDAQSQEQQPQPPGEIDPEAAAAHG